MREEGYTKIKSNPFNYTEKELNEVKFVLRKDKITWVDQALLRTCELFDNYLNDNKNLDKEESYGNLKKINTFLYTLAIGNKPLTKSNYNKVSELIRKTRAAVSVDALVSSDNETKEFAKEVSKYCECVSQCVNLKRLEALQSEVMNSNELMSQPIISRLADLVEGILKENNPDKKKVEVFAGVLKNCEIDNPENNTQDYHIELFKEYVGMCERYKKMASSYTRVTRRE